MSDYLSKKTRKTNTGARAMVTAATAGQIDPTRYTDTERELARRYGIQFDHAGNLLRGNASDDDYIEASYRYQHALNKRALAADGTAADARHTAALEAYRAAADRQNETLSRIRDETLRENAVMAERLSRYLPAANRLAGTTGSGVAESDAVARYNAVLASMNQAKLDYADGVRSTEDAFLENKRALDLQKQSDDTDRTIAALTLDRDTNESILNAYRTAAENRKQTSAELFASADADINGLAQSLLGEDGKIAPDDYQKIRAAAEQYRTRLDPADGEHMDILLRGYERLVRNESEQEIMEVHTTGARYLGGLNRIREGNNIEVSFGNAVYKVQIKERVSDRSILDQTADMEEGTVFAFGDELYMKCVGSNHIAKGTVVKLEGRSTNADDYENLKTTIRTTTK